MLSRSVRLWAAAGGGVVLALSSVVGALAHEQRTVAGGAYIMRVGWNAEPTFTGVRNAVQLFLSDAQDQPVDDLNGSLLVQVSYQGTTGGKLALVPAFEGNFGTPGEYDAPLTPTRPGNYTFHFTGTIHGTAIDQSFTSGPATFDTVQDASAIEFPVRDPSAGELSTALQRLNSRFATQIAAARSSANSANDAGTRATILGVIALLLALVLVVPKVAALVSRGRTRNAEEHSTQAG